jgi:hypothetical protein
LAAKLEELLRGVAWLRGWQVQHVGGAAEAEFDLLATLPLPGGGKAALCVECKRALRPSVFRMVADKTFSPAGRPSCTNVVQTYVDLCYCGGRGEEAAEALLNQRLKPGWKLRNMNV